MTKLIINVETGEELERDLTNDEIAQQLEDEKMVAEREKEIAKTKEARSALLEKLGITEEEAKLLLG